MRRVRACAAIAAWISATLLLPACSLIEKGTSLLQSVVPQSPPAPTLNLSPPQPAPLPPAPQSRAPPPANKVRAEIERWFAAAGYKEFQVAALAEHARIESGFRPCAAGAGDLRYTFQWAGTRLRHLHEFARTQGCPQLDTQLAFADKELRNDGKFSCFWRATTEPAALAALRRGFGRGNC